MRKFLLFIGWASVLGSLFDTLIAVHALVIIAGDGWNNLMMSVDEHLRAHLTFLYWIKDVAYVILPNGFVDWIFALPALVYFPIRLVLSIVVGAWALSTARKMQQQSAS